MRTMIFYSSGMKAQVYYLYRTVAILSPTTNWSLAILSLTNSMRIRPTSMVELDFPAQPPKWALHPG